MAQDEICQISTKGCCVVLRDNLEMWPEYEDIFRWLEPFIKLHGKSTFSLYSFKSKHKSPDLP